MEWGSHFSDRKSQTRIIRSYQLITKLLHEIKAFETAFPGKIRIVVGLERFFLLFSPFCLNYVLVIYISKYKCIKTMGFRM